MSGECFLPGEHLRISLADDAEFCNDIMCTALTDLDATPAGVLDPVIIQVQVAGKYELQQPGTIFIRVEHSGEGEGSEASEPLQVVLR